MKFYLALMVSILIGGSGQLLLKTGALKGGSLLLQPFTIAGLVAYFFSAMFYIFSLRKIPLSIAYPTIAISYVLVAYASHLIWGEIFGARQMVSMALIFSGIGMLYL